VIIATGISYRQLQVEGMKELRGADVFYNATQVEAVLCKDKPVHIVGAATSKEHVGIPLVSSGSESENQDPIS